ncbi:MAG: hypothetical protein ACP5N7_03775 [Candidatus Pacearchaeota archaeon]
MSLLLLSEYKEILDITGNTEDEFIEQAQYEVEAKIKEFLNRDIESNDYVELYDGNSDDELTLAQFPINSVSKIEVYQGLDSNNDEIWYEYQQGYDYQRLIIDRNKSTIILEGSVFPEEEQNIRVTYNAGYTTIPYEIQQACKKLMHLYYGEVKKTKSLGVSSSSEGSGFSKTVTFDNTAEKRILDSIEKYKAINV